MVYRDPKEYPPLKTATAVDRLKDLWNENPLLVIGVAAGATTAVAKLIDAVTRASNSKVWKKEVRRRERLTKAPR